MKPKLSFENFLLESHAVSADALARRTKGCPRAQGLFLSGCRGEERAQRRRARRVSREVPRGRVPARGRFPSIWSSSRSFPFSRYAALRSFRSKEKRHQITIATTNPANFLVTDEVRRLTKLTVKTVCTTEKAITEALERLSSEEQKRSPRLESGGSDCGDAPRGDHRAEHSTRRQRYSFRAAAQLCARTRANRWNALRDGADGSALVLPRWCPVLKLLAGMDIVEKRLAQDGRFKFKHGKGHCEIRGATLPTIYGEKMVLRLLRSDKSDPTLEMLDIGAAKARDHPKDLSAYRWPHPDRGPHRLR